LKTEVHLEGRIGDLEDHVEIDFANQNVGFGRTGTQVCQIRFKQILFYITAVFK